MTKSVIIVTGCDANFYDFMINAQRSLFALGLDARADFAVLDFGLTSAQKAEQGRLGVRVVAPEWPSYVPQEIRRGYQIGYVARTALRDYFPGYQIYLWFDADAWAQTNEFFELMVAGASATGAAVVRETGAGYHMDYLYRRWWYGNMMAAFGPVDGLRAALRPVINIGILALSDKAPHWQAWGRDYSTMIERRRRLNMDQHSFNYAVAGDHLPLAEIPPRCNWICTLSTPGWNVREQLFCEPTVDALPLSVLHLAGPDKLRLYRVKTTDGGILETSLAYEPQGGLQPA